jgi:DMSO/TMAO reductase YedYZ molybdopterin-dependent catalytic subunit
VRLADVLKHVGLEEAAVDEGVVAHVQFEGLDHDVSGTIYGASIPADRAIDPRADVLLAWDMNGKCVRPGHLCIVHAHEWVGGRLSSWRMRGQFTAATCSLSI